MDKRPPPRPGAPDQRTNNRQPANSANPGNKRHRMRTFSSGSTRGAFGPMFVDDAHKHKEIYEMQNAAMTNNFSNINNNGPPSEVKFGSAKKHPRDSHNNGHHHHVRTNDEELGVYRDSSTNSDVHPLNASRVTASTNGAEGNETPRARARAHVRVPSSDSNTRFLFSHHSPSFEDVKKASDQEDEIMRFSSNAAKRAGSYSTNQARTTYGTNDNSFQGLRSDDESENSFDEHEEFSRFQKMYKTLLYDKDKPEFTSCQQTSWAVLLGIFMGIFTALWHFIVEGSVEFVWVTMPKLLMELGIFTDLDGYLPLPHYMWICQAIFGGLLAYVTAEYAERGKAIPGQNEWIEQLHRVGVMEHERFFIMITIATLGMASGLSLGPEMPLVVTAGMVGSYIALKTNQSVLSSRVMNLTASAAGIGGFFGFPMAGALFVLELPHRMGLQYFEALSPSVIASIVSVIVNRMITQKHVEGYFDYPFLSETLPSDIFYTAIIYGIYGTLVGIAYADGVLWCKKIVHDWFHVHHDDHDHHDEHAHGDGHNDETTALVGGDAHAYETKQFKAAKKGPGLWARCSKCIGDIFGIEYEPYRATAAGVLAGVIVGLICMFLPHQLFWGEAQLQTVIDKGRTPLPVFEYGDEPISILTAYGYCMIDPDDDRAQIKGFSIPCTGLLSFTKILTIGISLGTGVCGGHFWGPLYVGCAASHFFTDIVALFREHSILAAKVSHFPCLAVLCVMGSTHVVTYRCHMAIMLVLTLTITSFTTEQKDGSTAGDYSAIFPLLVVSCFVPVMLARNCVFYAKQCCRGDIVAIPEVLCEPNKKGESVGSSFLSDGESYDSGLSEGSDDEGEEVMLNSGVHTRETSALTSDMDSSAHESEHVRIPSYATSSSAADPLAQSLHSIGEVSKLTLKSNISRGRVSSRDLGVRRPSPLARQSSFGKVEEMKPTLLNQARVRAASRSSTPINGPIVPSGRHRRKGSNMSMSSLSGLDSSKHSG